MRKTEEEKQLVIVLARNYSTGLSIVRSLGQAGYTVDLIASSYKKGASSIASYSKYIHRFTEVITSTVTNSQNTDLIDAILKYAAIRSKKPVLFPTDDYTTSVVDQNRSLLEEHFLMPQIIGSGDGTLLQRMDKSVQGNMAREAGFRTPKEWLLDLGPNTVIPEGMVYPCFCKPAESVWGHKSEMAVCDSKESLADHLAMLSQKSPGRRVLVQEYLNIQEEIDLSGVCLDQEVILPAIIRKTAVARYERGVTLSGRVCPLEEIEEVAENIRYFLRQLHYVGMFDMELNMVGNQIYFGEINLRSGGPNYIYLKSGVNLPDIFVRYLTGEPYSSEEIKIREYGKTFVYEKVAWEDHFHGFLSRKQLKACLNAADEGILCDKADPVPGRRFTVKMNLIAIRERLKQVLKRI